MHPDIARLARPNILALSPYSTARDDFSAGRSALIHSWLDANESPYPTGHNRYPDPHQRALKQRVAAVKGVEPDRVFCGNGSDEGVDLLYRIFCRPGADHAVAIAPSYGMYGVCAAVNDVALHEVLLGPGFSLPSRELLDTARAVDARLTLVCSPNNPTANAFPPEALLDLARRNHGLTVVDEAYIDYAPCASLAPLAGTPGLERLVVLQTLSKARGGAALRVGLAFAHPDVIGLMDAVKYPYNIPALSQQLALERLDDPAYPERLAETVAERSRLASALAALPGVLEVYPSDANFLLVRLPDPRAAYARLLEGGVVVRDRSTMPLLAGCLRITIGTPADNNRVINILSTL